MFSEGTNPGLATVYNPSKAYNGYTIFGPRGSKDMWLINMQGQFVHRWQLSTLVGDAKLLHNGNLIIGSRLPDSPIADLPACGGKLLELDWLSQKVWEYEDLYLNIHDCDRLENGNTLVSKMVPIPDQISAKVKGGIPGTERDGVMWSDCIQEITREGNIEWEWIAYEHMDFGKDILCPLCSRAIWTYINSLVGLPDGNILMSLRHINTIAILDKSTGEFTWRWGPGEIGHQHNPTMLENGNILVFDNGLHTPGGDNVAASRSRVLEVNPQTNKIEWEYKDKNLPSFYSPICSSSQRLPNGNTLICEATKGRIFEVTYEKELVWEFYNPFYFTYQPHYLGWTNMVFRAYRYGQDFEGLKGKKLDSDRFEWVVQEKGKKVSTEDEEKIKRDRIANLAY